MNKKLIQQLSADLKKVKVVKFNKVDTLKFILVGLFCVLAVVALAGIRKDFNEVSFTARYWVETILLSVLALASVVTSLALSIPGLESKKIWLFPFLTFGLLIMVSIYSLLQYSNSTFVIGNGFSCAYTIILTAIVPASFMFWQIRKAATLKRDLVGVLVVISGLSFGMLSVQASCSSSSPIHMFFWHVLPALLLAFVGILIGRKVIEKI